MTTAHRPTWAPAKGGEDQGGFKHYAPSQQIRVKDQGTSAPLKQRHVSAAAGGKRKDSERAAAVDDDGFPGLDAAGRARSKRAALRAALEARERAAARAERAAAFDIEREQDLLLLGGGKDGVAGATSAATEKATGRDKAPVAAAASLLDPDADVQSEDESGGEGEEGSDGEGGGGKDRRSGGASTSSDEDDDSDEDDSDDDEAELLAELERIKAERAAAARAAAAEEEAAVGAAARDDAMGGNPLLGGVEGASSFEVQRRWDDDVVFKHRSGGTGAAGAGRNDGVGKNEFINDTVRSQFHKRFLNRYIR